LNVVRNAVVKTAIHTAKICGLNWTKSLTYRWDTILQAFKLWKMNPKVPEMDAPRRRPDLAWANL